jgi:hypothetical protein
MVYINDNILDYSGINKKAQENINVPSAYPFYKFIKRLYRSNPIIFSSKDKSESLF